MKNLKLNHNVNLDKFIKEFGKLEEIIKIRNDEPLYNLTLIFHKKIKITTFPVIHMEEVKKIYEKILSKFCSLSHKILIYDEKIERIQNGLEWETREIYLKGIMIQIDLKKKCKVVMFPSNKEVSNNIDVIKDSYSREEVSNPLSMSRRFCFKI